MASPSIRVIPSPNLTWRLALLCDDDKDDSQKGNTNQDGNILFSISTLPGDIVTTKLRG
jgi:hypothetical protein